MATISQELIQSGGTYILKLLAGKPVIRYTDEFYDYRTDHTKQRLVEDALQAATGDDATIWSIDFAAKQLAAMGFVRIVELADIIPDDSENHDYEIHLVKMPDGVPPYYGVTL